MPSRETYIAMINSNGLTSRDRIINQTKKSIAAEIISSASYKSVVVNGDILKNLSIVATDIDNKKRFATLPDDSLNLGDLILWNGMHWLVTSIDFDNEIVCRGCIEQCNRILRWQNPHTLEIVERWCIATKPYTSNINEGNVVSTSNREYKIKLPYDEETKIVDLDKRFMLEIIDGKPRTYSMSSTDSLTNRYEDMGNDSGFIIWNLTQDLSGNPNDNVELMICDYIEPSDTPVPEPSEDKMTCSISGKSEIKCGYYRTYSAVFYNSYGDVIEGIVPYWELIPPMGHEHYYNTVLIENKVKVTVADNESCIGDTITLKLTNSDKTAVETSFDIKVVSAFG